MSASAKVEMFPSLTRQAGRLTCALKDPTSVAPTTNGFIDDECKLLARFAQSNWSDLTWGTAALDNQKAQFESCWTYSVQFLLLRPAML